MCAKVGGMTIEKTDPPLTPTIPTMSSSQEEPSMDNNENDNSDDASTTEATSSEESFPEKTIVFDGENVGSSEEVKEQHLKMKKRIEDAMNSSPREFESDFLKIYLHEPFLALISLEITKKPEGRIETAAVGFDPHTHDLVMFYNPEFFRSLTTKERLGVIRHELYHVIFGHITNRWPTDKRVHQVFNIATDMAINSIIGQENLPDLAIIPGKVIKPRKDMSNLDKKFSEFVLNAPHLQASDFYFEQIKKLIDEDKENGGDGTITVEGGIDEHDLWGRLPDHIRDMVKEKVKGIVEKAARNADQKDQWGNVPLEIQEKIRKMISKEVDWKSVLKNFIGRCRSSERVSTLKRINKKMPYIFPGVKRKQIANFACFIDQSGSVSDEDLVQFFGELESLSKEIPITVFHFDTEVDLSSETVWKKGAKVSPKRTRGGGTDFSCVANFLNDKKNRGRFTGCCILTDGYADKCPAVVGTKLLWVISSTGDISAATPGSFVVKMGSGNKQFKRT